METIWFILWGVLWTGYFVLDGFDLGLGTMMPFLARSDRDRRVIFNAQGPFWDGNEVWLITAGGATFAAFPKTYAVMFSTLYLPLLLLLFGLILRGVSFEFRNKVDSPAWRSIWDWCMIIGSFVPALLLGVAFANIFRGVPVDVDGIFHGNLLTLLNPYGLLGGVLFVLLFAVHGSNWLAIKAEGELAERAARMAKALWIPTVLVAVAFLVTSWFATPLWENYLQHVWMWVFPLLAVAGLLFTRWRMQGGRWWQAWGGSAAAIGGATLWGVAGLYPNLYPSSLDPAATLTVHNSSSSPLTLTIMLVVAGICVPGVIAYQSWVYYTFRGKVTDEVLSEPEAY